MGGSGLKPRQGLVFFWIAAFFLAFLLALMVGSGQIGWTDVFGSESTLGKSMFWKLRFPRAVAAAAVGGGLALVGAVLQSSLRNPLADPFLLGVSSAAAVGAVLALATGMPGLRFPLSIASALVCLIFLDKVAYRKGVFSTHNLLLAGVAVTYLLSAATAVIVLLADPTRTRGLLFWLMGGFSALDVTSTAVCAIMVVVVAAWMQFEHDKLDTLALGDESAHILGLRPNRFRRALFLGSAVVVGLTVATAGGIGFVGILVPHIARLFCGVSHKTLLPLCLLGGATLTLLSDTFARTVISPREIPVGLLTALMGAPFFLHQLRRGQGF
ncbi:MAG: iron ABC transporter permease [Candidatus Eremiobacteraeota bacterium]|nr:iron ABC transporter permease [Candidatus Eremiobacteraeota bacterium]